MFHDRFDGALMAVFLSIEFATLLGVSAWAAGDLAGLSKPLHYVILAIAGVATVALITPLWRRMLAPAIGR